MPDLNTLSVQPASRQPRGAVRLNGAAVAGWVSWEVENNAYRAADTFRVAFVVGGLPDAVGPSWFAQQSGITCEIFANENPSDPARYQPVSADSIILGAVDDIDYDPQAGLITISGRDLTAKLIDTKTSEHFANQTASQIATTLAQRHGLTPVVTATGTRVGSYYTIDHVQMTQEQSEWELLTSLAVYEDFDVYVTGNELHFGPKPADTGVRYAIQWTAPDGDHEFPQANTTTLHFTRALTIAKGVAVTVRSWNAKQKKAFTASWPKSIKATKPGQATNSAQVYSYTIAGLTQDQATKRAQRIYDQIVAHAVALSADLPGDGILDCGKILQVRGTGTAWDQVYYPDSVKRSMAIDEGYRMAVTAKNLSQDIEATQ